MEIDDYVAQLMKGVVAWNAWRAENPTIVAPEFTAAFLSGSDLRRANLRGAILVGTHLFGANLEEADLSQAYLINADLSQAKLSKAKLTGADLSRSNIGSANFSKANLKNATLSSAIGHAVNFDKANLSKAKMPGAYFENARFNGANLHNANLKGVNLENAEFRKTNLIGVYLNEANLRGTRFVEAKLDSTNLSHANLSMAQCVRSDLKNANLENSILVDTNFSDSDLTSSYVYGISAWNLNLDNTKQINLKINGGKSGDTNITVDNIEVAQLLYLFINNNKIRSIIDAITSKVVLILGRFTPERKIILDAIREELRGKNYLPVLFDFDKPTSRDVTETISLLARMARFVLADITDARSIPQELNVIVPHLPSVPVQPLLHENNNEYGMFEHYKRFPWVLPIYRYETQNQLILDLGEKVIGPAEYMAKVLRTGSNQVVADAL